MIRNSTLKRRAPLRAKKAMKRGTTTKLKPRARMKKVGRRTNDWRRVWRFLKPRLEAAGRTACEFDFIPHECDNILDPAHSKKRNKMKGLDIYAVALACRRVHDHLDLELSHEEMEQAVMEAINRNGGIILPA